MCTPAYSNYHMYSIQQSKSIPFEVQVGFIENLLVSRRNPLTPRSDKHCNFSLKYLDFNLHTGNENTQTNQVEVFLIHHQILITNLQEDVLQLEGRINNHILGL